MVSRDVVFFMGDQRFESSSLQRSVSCELDFRRYGAVRYPEPEDGPWRLSAIGQGSIPRRVFSEWDVRKGVCDVAAWPKSKDEIRQTTKESASNGRKP